MQITPILRACLSTHPPADSTRGGAERTRTRRPAERVLNLNSTDIGENGSNYSKTDETAQRQAYSISKAIFEGAFDRCVRALRLKVFSLDHDDHRVWRRSRLGDVVDEEIDYLGAHTIYMILR